MFFEKLFKKMDASKVKYLVIGGAAVNLHGFMRATGDLDITLLLEDSNLRKFIKILELLGLKPRIPIAMADFANKDKRNEWIKTKNLKAVSFYNPKNESEHLDVVIEHNLNFKGAYKNRKIIKQGDLRINLIPIDELIRMKEYANRERDKIDIRALERIKELNND